MHCVLSDCLISLYLGVVNLQFGFGRFGCGEWRGVMLGKIAKERVAEARCFSPARSGLIILSLIGGA